jgi:ABC-type antimicrobial peptide transport system permease subunit
MPSQKSETEQLTSSLHRGLLGLLLGIVGIFAIEMARGLLVGDYLIGIIGVIVTFGIGYWILSLFFEGLQER